MIKILDRKTDNYLFFTHIGIRLFDSPFIEDWVVKLFAPNKSFFAHISISSNNMWLGLFNDTTKEWDHYSIFNKIVNEFSFTVVISKEFIIVRDKNNVTFEKEIKFKKNLSFIEINEDSLCYELKTSSTKLENLENNPKKLMDYKNDYCSSLIESAFGLDESHYQKFMKSVSEELSSFVKQKKVLDVGCFNGKLQDNLSCVKSYTGVEISRYYYNKYLKDKKGNFLCQDFLDLSKRSFDVILAVNSIYYIDYKKFFEKSKELLTDDGVVIIVNKLRYGCNEDKVVLNVKVSSFDVYSFMEEAYKMFTLNSVRNKKTYCIMAFGLKH